MLLECVQVWSEVICIEIQSKPILYESTVMHSTHIQTATTQEALRLRDRYITQESVVVLNHNGMSSRSDKICFLISFLKQVVCKQNSN